MNAAESVAELRAAIDAAITEDWEIVKDTAGKFADRHSMFEMAYRFGWHAATKYWTNRRQQEHEQP